MAGLGDVGKEFDEILEKVKQLKSQNINVDTGPIESSIKSARSAVQGLGSDSKKTADTLKASGSVIVDALGGVNSVLGRVTKSILDVGTGTMEMGNHFKNAFNNTYIDSFVDGFDELTAMTRDLRTSAINVGNSFGLSFDQIRGSYQSYTASILFAQNATYENRAAIQQSAEALGQLGVGLTDITRQFGVAGTQQSILTEGFLLSADSGLRSEKVFAMMGTAMLKMGLSAEDAGRPLLALENIAKETGLPIQELSSEIFRTAEQGARLGLTVDAMTPIVRRFVDVLGPGFKGLAIDETTKLIHGLEGQINKTESAFMAMQGGLARPGAGVAEAMIAFEDAFKNPIDVVKSLQTTIGGITGGKIIKFEEARANPELANQFKLQRDLLQQLTGNTDPQSQRTLMGILSDLQSGRTLSAAQNKTLEESLKSGSQKQEEQKTLADRIGKAQVGLLTQISVNTSAMFDRLLPPQVQAGFAKVATEKGVGLEQRGIELFNKALESGSKLLESIPGATKIENTVKDTYQKVITTGENAAAVPRGGINYSIPAFPGTPAPLAATTIPEQVAPSPFTGGRVPQPATGAPQPTVSTKTTTAPGEKEGGHVTVTFRGTDELTKAIANAASSAYNKTLHGNG